MPIVAPRDLLALLQTAKSLDFQCLKRFVEVRLFEAINCWIDFFESEPHHTEMNTNVPVHIETNLEHSALRGISKKIIFFSRNSIQQAFSALIRSFKKRRELLGKP